MGTMGTTCFTTIVTSWSLFLEAILVILVIFAFDVVDLDDRVCHCVNCVVINVDQVIATDCVVISSHLHVTLSLPVQLRLVAFST